MNSNSVLKEENILTLFSLNNLIVPEIQREYVWGNNPDVIGKFLEDIKETARTCRECHYVHTTEKVNIGFLYSYKPPYVSLENERYLDEYLIDGQQRVTTIFLLLLVRAVKENRLDDFFAICRVDESGRAHCFNYKVRALTQMFLDELLTHVKVSDKTSSLDFILTDDKPSWFLSDYTSDPTVNAMESALRIILQSFPEMDSYYYDYLLHNIYFWHFKTEETSQGEELYITMNSRGEQLSSNELQKANVLPENERIKWGATWEEWQTFFWRNRKNNPDADEGFNSYLSCIDGMRKLLLKEDNSPSITELELYIYALKTISSPEFKDSINALYPNYNDWYEEYIGKVWRYINGRESGRDTDWTVPDPQKEMAAYKNASATRNKVLLFWPFMFFFLKLREKQDSSLPSLSDDDILQLIRIIRFFYTRNNSFRRTASTVGKVVSLIMNNHPSRLVLSKDRLQDDESIDEDEEGITGSRLFSEEEFLISDILQNKNDDDCRLAEEAIWRTQDISFFKDGQYVGGDTFYVYLSDSSIVSPDNIVDDTRVLRENFEKLKIDTTKYDTADRHIIREILLYYKENTNQVYWKQQSPYYYSNYDTSTWNRIVRTPCFVHFYKDFFIEKAGAMELNEFLKFKQNEFFNDPANCAFDYNEPSCSHRKLAIYYSICGDRPLWDGKDHFNIAFWASTDTDGLFRQQNTLWCGWRYFDKYAQIKLRKDWQDVLRNSFPNSTFTFNNYPVEGEDKSVATES